MIDAISSLLHAGDVNRPGKQHSIHCTGGHDRRGEMEYACLLRSDTRMPPSISRRIMFLPHLQTKGIPSCEVGQLLAPRSLRFC